MGKGGKKAPPQGKGSSAPQGKAYSAPGGGGRHSSSRRQRASGGWSKAVEAQLDAGLAALGLVRSGIAGDGNCLFATIAEQHLGSAHRHPETRALAIATMRACPAAFQPFLLEEDLADLHVTDYDSYLDKMAQEREWGGNLELTALANALARCMVVHRAGERPYVLAPSEPAAAARAQLGQPFHLAYDGQHYDSVREIAGAVVGVKAAAAAAAGAGSEEAPQDDPKVAALLQAFSGMSLSRERAQAALLAARGVLDSAIEAIAVGIGGCAGGGAEGAEACAEGAEEGVPAVQQSDGEGAATAAAAAAPPPPAAAPPPLHPGGKKGGAPAHGAGPPAAVKAPPRNKPCPCGSALPYKKCCASKPRAGGGGAPKPGALQDSPARSSLAATFGGLDV